MFINVPKGFKPSDIKRCGIIYKTQSYSYILSDIENRNKKNTLLLNGCGFYNYIYDICNTYLFIIGNQKGNKDINPNKIDFLAKILKFEYLLNNKNRKIQKFDVPSGIFTITSKERWLQDDLMGDSSILIDNIIKHKKIHLQAYERPYERYMRYLCDNPETNIGTFKNGLCKDLLTQNYIQLMKDTSIDGYIIKTDDRPFIC